MINNSVSHNARIIIIYREGRIMPDKSAMAIKEKLEKIRQIEEESKWYPPLYFLMSRKEMISTKPNNMLWLIIQNVAKIKTGIISNNK